VKEVENLLLTEYHVFEHSETGSLHVACDEYHVPAHITNDLDYITPGIRLRHDEQGERVVKKRENGDMLQSRRVKASNVGFVPFPETYRTSSDGDTPFNSSICDQAVTPVCIRSECQNLFGSDCGW